jgi:hypothetical protein
MGDLFEGYGTLAAARRASGGAMPFDEMFRDPPVAGEPAVARAAYREIHAALSRMTKDEL